MKPVHEMSLEELAAWVCQALADAGIQVVLTGGACVTVWTGGDYVSRDLDFVERGFASRHDIKDALDKLGFTESHRYFIHPDTEFLIEFPSGPLAVGDSPVTEIAERNNPTGRLHLLSANDCVKDRLAAWFHWRDRQALEQAIKVARSQSVDVERLRSWARAEHAEDSFGEFLDAIAADDE